MSAPAPEGRVVVLLDIDGTLLDVRGAGRTAFVRALRLLYGWEDDIRYIQFAGATDSDVLDRILAHHGRTGAPEETARFFDELARQLDAAMRETPVQVLPGVRELLNALSSRPRALAGLVTGNIEQGARIKLQHAGLDGHFVLGAFGCEHADRVRLASLALDRARAAAGRVPIASVFLIGDTPSDIQAAVAIGARAFAVATGKYDAAALRAAGADRVYDTLADTDSLLADLGL